MCEVPVPPPVMTATRPFTLKSVEAERSALISRYALEFVWVQVVNAAAKICSEVSMFIYAVILIAAPQLEAVVLCYLNTCCKV